MKRFRICGTTADIKGEITERGTKYDNFTDMTLFWDTAMRMGERLKHGCKGTLLMYDGHRCIQNIKIGPTK